MAIIYEKEILGFEWQYVNRSLVEADADYKKILTEYNTAMSSNYKRKESIAATKAQMIKGIRAVLCKPGYYNPPSVIKPSSPIKMGYFRNTKKNTDVDALKDICGINLELHPQILENKKVEFSEDNGLTAYRSIAHSNINSLLLNDLICVNGYANYMNEIDALALYNGLNKKILFVAGAPRDCSLNKIGLPFSFIDNPDGLAISKYRKITTSRTYDLWQRSDAKILLMDISGEKRIGYRETANGYIFQWIEDIQFENEEDKKYIDTLIIKVLEAIVAKWRIQSSGGGNDGLVISGSPASSKQITVQETNRKNIFPSEISYSKDGYSGTLTRTGSSSVLSGSVEQTATKIITIDRYLNNQTNELITLFPATIDYEEDGYKGVLSRENNLQSTPIIISRGKVVRSDAVVISLVTSETLTEQIVLSFIESEGKNTLFHSFEDPDVAGGVIECELDFKEYKIIRSILEGSNTRYDLLCSYQKEVQLPTIETGEFNLSISYGGSIIRTLYDNRVWVQSYKGVVSKADTRVYFEGVFSDVEKSIAEIIEHKLTIEKKIVKLGTGKRHVIRLCGIDGKANIYKELSTAQTDDILKTTNLPVDEKGLIKKIEVVALYVSEYIPDHFTDTQKESCLEYYISINGKEYPVVPINSGRNGTKIIRSGDNTYVSDYTVNIKEDIKSLYAGVRFITDKKESPFISNIKILMA